MDDNCTLVAAGIFRHEPVDDESEGDSVPLAVFDNLVDGDVALPGVVDDNLLVPAQYLVQSLTGEGPLDLCNMKHRSKYWLILSICKYKQDNQTNAEQNKLRRLTERGRNKIIFPDFSIDLIFHLKKFLSPIGFATTVQ